MIFQGVGQERGPDLLSPQTSPPLNPPMSCFTQVFFAIRNLFTCPISKDSSCLLGSFSCFGCCFLSSSADFFQNKLFWKILLGTPSVSNSFDPDQTQCFVGPDLGPNSLQWLSADHTKRQRVNPHPANIFYCSHWVYIVCKNELHKNINRWESRQQKLLFIFIILCRIWEWYNAMH